MRRFAEKNLVQMTSIQSITLINCVMMTGFNVYYPSTPFEFLFFIFIMHPDGFWCFFPLQSFSFIMHSDVFIAWPVFSQMGYVIYRARARARARACVCVCVYERACVRGCACVRACVHATLPPQYHTCL